MALVLIAGCGYVGRALASELVSQGHEVWGLSRSATGLPAGALPLEADLLTLETLGAIPERVDFVVYSAAPRVAAGADDDERRAAYREVYLDGLGNLLRTLAEQGESPKRVFFTSSTSVYAQRRGEWVDEDSPTEPRHFSGQMQLMAEGLLRGSPFPATSVRFGGIYGPGRTRLLDNVRAGRAHWRTGAPHYTNRIHRDDAAGILAHLIGRDALEPLYVGVDSEPAEERVVYEWLAKQLGAPMPTPSEEDDGASPRRAGSKRCNNARVLATGYRIRYPSFREGYGAMIHDADSVDS